MARRILEGKLFCTVKTLAGLEEVLKKEVEDSGFQNIKLLRRAVKFETDLEGVYRANLTLRTALSVLVSIANFKYRSKDDVYKNVREIQWEQIFNARQTFAVKGTIFSKVFPNTLYPLLLVKDAIADKFRDVEGRRPNVNRERPDILIDVYINEQFCTISLNSSGDPLFMRGYRNMAFPAPLNECLAAGMLFLSGWSPGIPISFPMCGSGTLAVEAAMMASNTFPQQLRESFSFKRWMNFDQIKYDRILKALDKVKPVPTEISASDISNRAVSITRNSLRTLGLENTVDLEKMDFLKGKPKSKDGMLILNPPYDERIKSDDIDALYANIGDKMKQGYTGLQVWILSGNIEALKKIGLKPGKKIQLLNGKLPCEFVSYDLYEGSKRKPK